MEHDHILARSRTIVTVLRQADRSDTVGGIARSITALDKALTARIAQQVETGELSATVLLSSFFGDVAEPRGAFVSVAGVASVVAPLGATERSARTALNRLTRDGLLTTVSQGGRSFYGVAPRARPTFIGVRERVFRGTVRTPWDGWWTMVAIDSRHGTAEERSGLRQELGWLGLTAFAPNVLVSPEVPVDAVASVIEQFGDLRVVLTRSQVIGVEGHAFDDVDLAGQSIELAPIRRRYETLIETWRPIAEADGPADPELAAAARVLLVSDLRRVVLADPSLPPELLPTDWPAPEATRVAAAALGHIIEASETFFTDRCPTSAGPLPPPVAEQSHRFAGLSVG